MRVAVVVTMAMTVSMSVAMSLGFLFLHLSSHDLDGHVINAKSLCNLLDLF